MSLLDTALIPILTRALDLTAQRQTLVSQNIANIDTPGYHARDLDFRKELQRALPGDQDLSAAEVPFVREVRGLIERPDGNNVSIDRESLLMAQNQLLFQTEAQLLHAEFNRLQLAINGGSGQ
ncbi:MAG: flagellar basal body protein [Candidatus Korobacteraceae bacterium]